MTPQELGVFLKEEVPRIRKWMTREQLAMSDMGKALSALDAAVGLLREAENRLAWALSKLDRGDGVWEYTGPAQEGERAKIALAALRLVCGEEE